VIIVDNALEQRERDGDPIRVGMVGAGFMGHAIALQLLTAACGLRLAAIANRTVERALDCFSQAGQNDVRVVEDVGSLERSIAEGRYAVTEDALVLAQAEGLDALIEVTGTVEPACRVVLTAIEHGKHVVLMNAELDGTVGPILKSYADRRGVVITNADGDQPGVQMNLWRFVAGIGVRPVLCGNIKSLHDPHRNPTTQEAFARRWGQSPRMVTSFADGTKISFEQAIVANATGMTVAKRGMHGPTVAQGTHVREAGELFPADELLDGPGLVDYVVGAEPSPGVFVLGVQEDARQQHYLELYKLGTGPLYCFYVPYHLCHFEVPNTVGRAVLFGDAAIAAQSGLRVEVVAVAKRDLARGETIDGLGGYSTYGVAERADVVRAADLLPIGLAEGARLLRDVAQDDVFSLVDVELPPGRLCDRLRVEQDALVAAPG
jgi:predicted homoserine dehydrogenase-like protein